jgi:hypothetical protein
MKAWNISCSRQFHSVEAADIAIAPSRTTVNPFELKTVLLAKDAQQHTFSDRGGWFRNWEEES